MEFSITRSGKKIVLTEEELNGIFIKKDYYDFVEELKEFSDDPEFISLYLYLSTKRDVLEKDILEETLELLGIDIKKKTRQSLNDIDFSVLEEEEETE